MIIDLDLTWTGLEYMRIKIRFKWEYITYIKIEEYDKMNFVVIFWFVDLEQNENIIIALQQYPISPF